MNPLAIIKRIDGTHFDIVNTDPAVVAHFANPNNYTREIIAQFTADYYRDFITPSDKVIVDIGANIGLFALHVSPWAKKIICVEPTPEHGAILQQLMPRAILEQAALAEVNGQAQFYWCSINTTMNSLQPRGDRAFTVSTLTLPALLDKYMLDHVDLVKIDIEGSEHQAITPGIIAAVAPRVRKFFMEVHPPNHVTVSKFVPMFEAAGYRVQRYVHDSLFATVEP
jgi:FkbM family methyltransferase